MKNCLIVFFLFITRISSSQEPETFYQTEDKEYAFKFSGEGCILYRLSKYENDVSHEWELKPVERFGKQLDSLGILFSNGEYAVSYDYKYFRVCKLKNGKVKNGRAFVAKKLDNPSKVYEAVNHSFWGVIYRKMMDEISGSFPLFHAYFYRYKTDNWESNQNKQVSPVRFEILAIEQVNLLKDSLSKTNRQLISLNDSIEKNMNTLTLEALKSNLLNRPLHQYHYDEYQDVMLESVAEKRPDLFFDLAEAIPTEKEYLFGRIYVGDAVKSLKKFDTDAPVKKEYLKFRRKESMKAGLIMTGGVLLEAGVIGGVITGIVFWIRK